VLRTSRFFPEEDDVAERAAAYSESNLKANEFLYRRVDIEDVVSSHFAAIGKAAEIGFGKFIITATTPFDRNDLAQLGRDAPSVVSRYFPDFPALYDRAGWKMLPALDRVYVNSRALQLLGWRPRYDFAHVLRCLADGKDFRSALTLAVGAKGYHPVS